jgi:hypothetical protein
MRTRLPLVWMVLVFFIGSFGMVAHGEADAKYTIKEVMNMAHKGDNPLCKKAVAEKTTKEENEKLLEMYVAMSQDKPKKGDAKVWDTKTAALVDAAKLAVAGEKGYGAKLKVAVDCKACHSIFK